MFPNQPFSSDFVPRQQQQQQPLPLQNARPRLALQQLRRPRPSPQRMSLPNNSAATSLAPVGSHAQAWQGAGFGHGTAAGLRPANPVHTRDHQTAASGVLEEMEANFQPGIRSLNDIYAKMEGLYIKVDAMHMRNEEAQRDLTQAYGALNQLLTMVQKLDEGYQNQKDNLEGWATKLEALFELLTQELILCEQQRPPQQRQQLQQLQQQQQQQHQQQQQQQSQSQPQRQQELQEQEDQQLVDPNTLYFEQ